MPTIALDEIDLKILKLLEADGRLTNVELASQVGLSPSPCLRRVRRLEAEHVIEGYGARINRTKVGFGLTAFVEVKLDRPREAEARHFRESVQNLPNVLSCYLISGEPDFLLEVTVSDLSQYSGSLLTSLRGLAEIKDVQSSFVLETLKRPSRLPWQSLES
jgi:Lrp/AsnC family transcriptional regulator, leucine-responsive regulatory protein